MPEGTQILQILYECEKCGEVNAHLVAIAANTVNTRLCPTCNTAWGQYIRAQDAWLNLLEVDWEQRHAIDIAQVRRAIVDQLRYTREVGNLALKWLGRKS